MPESPEGVAQNRKQRRILNSLARRIRRGMVREAWREYDTAARRNKHAVQE